MHVSHPAQLLCTELLYKSRESKKCRLSVVRSGCSHGRCRRCRTEFCAEQLPAASSTTCRTARSMFSTFPLAKFLADSDTDWLSTRFFLFFLFSYSCFPPTILALFTQFSSCYSNWMKFIHRSDAIRCILLLYSSTLVVLHLLLSSIILLLSILTLVIYLSKLLL